MKYQIHICQDLDLTGVLSTGGNTDTKQIIRNITNIAQDKNECCEITVERAFVEGRGEMRWRCGENIFEQMMLSHDIKSKSELAR
jgi:hypothetical protein